MKKLLNLLTVKNLLILGFVLRLLLIFLDFSFDVNNHILWGEEIVKYGASGFYERPGHETFATLYPNYPPLIIFLFSLCYFLYQTLFSVIWWINLHVPAFPSGIVTFMESRNALAGFMKLPGIIGDLGVAYLLYLFTVKITKNKKSGIGSMILVVLNPVFFYTSSLWGQVDVLPMMFFLWSVYVLLYKPQKIWSGVLFTAALLTKQTAVIYIPIYLFLVFKTVKPKEYLKIFSVIIGLVWLSFLPFYQTGNLIFFPFKIYLEKILFVSGIPFISNHAFNFWALVSQWHDIPDTGMFFGFQYKIWGYLIASIFLIFIFIKFIKSTVSLEKILFVSLIWDFTVFQFFTRMHERHFIPVLILLIPLIWKNKKFIYLFYILSFFHMVNLYHNWSVPAIKPLLTLITSQPVENSFIVLGLTIYFLFLYELFHNKSTLIQK
jgi:Gpi18-like mannosyltransferase